MAFLDNSGDIILDAVLTDTGRRRMANGTFNVTQFALGDDEIDYSLYNKSAANSALSDLNILQTPILESFTNNMSSLKSKLITIGRTDFLYLPILKLYNSTALNRSFIPNSEFGMHLIAVDGDTETNFSNLDGVIKGLNLAPNSRGIKIDQGTDSISEPGAGQTLEPDLIETGYILEIDNRLGSIISYSNTSISAQLSYIDDDNVASYFISQGAEGSFIETIPAKDPTNITGDNGVTVLNGKRGTSLKFSVKSTSDLASSVYLFERLGSATTLDGKNIKYIDTSVRITGLSTGYRIDVPIRFIKKI